MNHPATASNNEIGSWEKHRQILQNVPAAAVGFRGCYGLALAVEALRGDSFMPYGDHLFVPDATVRWASIVDIPRGIYTVNRATRELQWGAASRTCAAYGMPVLHGRGDGQAWDLLARPESAGWSRAAAFRPNAYNTQLFRVFTALQWAMTAWAFNHASRWLRSRDQYEKDGGLPPLPEASEASWAPRAYLAFPSSLREQLFDLATTVPGQPARLYIKDLREAFVRAVESGLTFVAPFTGRMLGIRNITWRDVAIRECRLADGTGREAVVRFGRQAQLLCSVGGSFKAGDPIGRETWELPKSWLRADLYSRWGLALDEIFVSPRIRDAYVAMWFDRHIIMTLKTGVIHAPALLAAPAALGHAVASELYWDVGPGMNYYNEEAEAFIFPPLRREYWDEYRGQVGDLAYDLTPTARFLKRRPQRPVTDRGRQPYTAQPVAAIPV